MDYFIFDCVLKLKQIEIKSVCVFFLWNWVLNLKQFEKI